MPQDGRQTHDKYTAVTRASWAKHQNVAFVKLEIKLGWVKNVARLLARLTVSVAGLCLRRQTHDFLLHHLYMQTKLSDGTVYRIISNIAILKAYRSNLWWSIPPGSLPMYSFNFQLLFFIVVNKISTYRYRDSYKTHVVLTLINSQHATATKMTSVDQKAPKTVEPTATMVWYTILVFKFRIPRITR